MSNTLLKTLLCVALRKASLNRAAELVRIIRDLNYFPRTSLNAHLCLAAAHSMFTCGIPHMWRLFSILYNSTEPSCYSAVMSWQCEIESPGALT
jgi:hypothetical protein